MNTKDSSRKWMWWFLGVVVAMQLYFVRELLAAFALFVLGFGAIAFVLGALYMLHQGWAVAVESLASFIADRLTYVYLDQKFGPNSPERSAYSKEDEEGNRRGKILHQAYNVGEAEFTRLYETCGKDWGRFLEALRKLQVGSFKKEHEEDLRGVILPLADAGCR